MRSSNSIPAPPDPEQTGEADVAPSVDSSRPSMPGSAQPSDFAPVMVEIQSPTDDPADRWLIQLRWGAVVGMGATVISASQLVEGIRITALLGVLALIALGNLGWFVALRQRRAAGSSWARFQVIGDVLALGLMLWFAGGTTNPFASYLVFQIALAGLLCTPRVTLGVAALTLGSVFVLYFAEPLPPVSEQLAGLADAVSIFSLSGFLAACVAAYASRLDRFRQQSGRDEKLVTMGRLVGTMSHELNTPLNTIMLASNDLLRFGGLPPNSEAEHLAQSIAGEARRATEIVGLMRGHLSPDQVEEEVELSEFVREFAEVELDRLGFTGRRTFDSDGAVQARIIRSAFGQILVNVLTNAAEASALTRRRQIDIQVKRIHPAVAEVSVQDRGPGFRPEILARLGEPFQTTKDVHGGMGMGLYISSQLAMKMGMVLRVQSAPGGGAKVTLTLECSSESQQIS